ncbi:hypothetical protein M5689_014926 [Euphorbia peplus]|nr:hypothetical protein M5689_014926 [Euphorbia peplus]
MESFEDHEIPHSNPDHGWQKVTYAKRNRKQKPGAAGDAAKPNGSAAPGNVFLSLEQQSEERRRRIVETQRAAIAAEAAPVRSRQRSDDDDDEDDDSDEVGVGGKVEEKKVKVKKVKKPKVTVAEAAGKIDAGDLTTFLVEVSASYEGQQEIQLMRFADYFGRAFSAVSSAQFPWVKLFRENPVAKMTDIPLSHVSDDVYRASIDWISQRPIEALSSFVLWSVDCIFADLASQQPSKNAKKATQHVSSKSQVGIFVALAMVLRRRPDALVNVLPTLRDTPKYQGQDKVAVVAWMIAQVSLGDLAVGLYSWAHNLLPIVSGKSPNPQSRDIMLQLVEKILSSPKARTILVSGAVRKGERLIPPFALEILVRNTFPLSANRIKATERFEAIYPTLKEVALAGSTGSKAMKQVALQILSFAAKAAGESNPQLSKEAAGICTWCLTQNAECYKHWDKIYLENPEASVAILKKLSEDWKDLHVKLAPLDPLRQTLKSFRQKNEKAIADGEDAAVFKEADKYCKMIQGKSSRGGCCSKGMVFAVIALAVGAAVYSPNVESWDLKNLVVMVNSQLKTQFSY